MQFVHGSSVENPPSTSRVASPASESPVPGNPASRVPSPESENTR